MKAGIEIGHAGIAVADHGGLVAGRGVLPRLAEQDVAGAFGGQPVGQNRAGRAATDDDGVVHFHFGVSLLLFFALSCLFYLGKLAHLRRRVTPSDLMVRSASEFIIGPRFARTRWRVSNHEAPMVPPIL